VKYKKEAGHIIINPTVRCLINDYPMLAVQWLTLFDEFATLPIMPSKLPPNRRYKITMSMLKLMAYDLAEQLPDVKPSGAGRPAKVYCLKIPSL
jgi:hypothetical protein